MKNTLIILLFSSLLINLTACSVIPPNANGSSATTDTINSSSAEIKRANQLLRQGKKLEAASAYFQISHKHPSPQRERLVLQAAEIATYVKDKSLARHYLSKVNPSRLSNENRARRSYVLALIAILDNNYQAALKTLPAQRGTISAGLWSKIHRVRQQASAQTTAGNSTRTSNPATLPQNVNQVAVLLPLSGKLGTLGNIILKGIRSSKQTDAPNIKIKTYDVASTDILVQYKRAVDEGANVIIGPLDKRKLSILAKQRPQLTRPVISLNRLNAGQGTAPAALYQFGLAPEDEARQIAGFATSRGQRRAAILYPDSQWGKRLSDAFRQMYTSQGGQVIAESAYPNTSTSYKPSVKQVLAGGANSVDMIFLAAAPTQARLIRPMIQHLHGENIPLYATSHIYSGQPDAGKNTDLNGIVYTEIPYIIEGSQLAAITPRTGKYPRLFAMGADALLIAKDLNAMARGGKTLQGKTGNIRIGGNRFLQRKLALATFVNGLTTSYGE